MHGNATCVDLEQSKLNHNSYLCGSREIEVKSQAWERRACGNDFVMLENACFTFHRVPRAQQEEMHKGMKPHEGKHETLPRDHSLDRRLC